MAQPVDPSVGSYPNAETYIQENNTTRNSAGADLRPFGWTLGGIATLFFTGAYFNKVGKIVGTIGTVAPLSLLLLVYRMRLEQKADGSQLFAEKAAEAIPVVGAAGLSWQHEALQEIVQDSSNDPVIVLLQQYITPDTPALPNYEIPDLREAHSRVLETTQLNHQLIGQVNAWAEVLKQAGIDGNSKMRGHAAHHLFYGLTLCHPTRKPGMAFDVWTKIQRKNPTSLINGGSQV